MSEDRQKLEVTNDNGTKEVFYKDEMSEEQTKILEELAELNARVNQLQPLATEFRDKMELVNIKSKVLVESLKSENIDQEDGE
tara:strand:- start:221 stop:469 length:249 start_codon:yes stop_codon:yes gene_type:complete